MLKRRLLLVDQRMVSIEHLGRDDLRRTGWRRDGHPLMAMELVDGESAGRQVMVRPQRNKRRRSWWRRLLLLLMMMSRAVTISRRMAESSRIVQRVTIGRWWRTDWVLVMIARLLLLVNTISSPLVTLRRRMVKWTRRVVTIGVRMVILMMAIKVRSAAAAVCIRRRLLVMTDEVHWFVFNGHGRFAMIARQISRLMAVRRRRRRRALREKLRENDRRYREAAIAWALRKSFSSWHKLNHLFDSATKSSPRGRRNASILLAHLDVE